METQASAIECALAGLFDYAGMFPPAQLELRAALEAYRKYGKSAHSWALGNLVIRASDIQALQAEAGNTLRGVQLTVLATGSDLPLIGAYFDLGLPIDMVESKAEEPEEIRNWGRILPPGVTAYLEIPTGKIDAKIFDAMRAAGTRAKLRLGGVIAGAFQPADLISATLKQLAEARIPFKATAGLHHPLRSRHPLTYEPGSPSGLMHGFMNLLCASAHVWFGGSAEDAAQILDEQDARVWQVTASAMQWRSFAWNAGRLRQVRERFLIRIGSCSFTEPIHDLEALGWL